SIGSKLNLRWAVWGTFQKVMNSIRITAHFTDVSKSELLGSVKLDGTMEDIFSLQDRIVTGLLETLRIDISSSDIQKIQKPQTVQLQAYECYAKGRKLFNLFGKSSFEEAQNLFEKAIELDPNYALAYSGLGCIYIFKFISHTDPRDLDIGISHMQRAQKLDPDLTEPHHWLAYAY